MVRPTRSTTMMLADGDKRKALLMQKKKRDFDYLTTDVLMEQQKHLLASIHFKAVYTWLLFIPSIGITLAGGILAVLLERPERYSDEGTSSVFAICIAVLASVSVFWQLDMGGRAMLHDSAAVSLRRIYNLALMRSKEESIFEMEIVAKGERRGEEAKQDDKESASGDYQGPDEEDPRDGHDHFLLSKEFEQALQGCTSEVPIRLSAAFNSLHTRIDASNKKLVPSSNITPRISWEKVYPAIYHQLTLTIIGSKLWPFAVPDAEWAVNKAINDFREHNACLMKDLVNRTHEIDKVYTNFDQGNRTSYGPACGGENAPEMTPLIEDPDPSWAGLAVRFSDADEENADTTA